MKRILVLALLLVGLLPGDAVHAQTAEISARGASIRFGGRVQAQFQSSSVDGAASDLFFRRARLIADATVTDFWGGRLQVDFSGDGPHLADAYVHMNFSDGFRVAMGQFKRAFDLFELSSSAELSIIERDGRIDGLGGCTGVGRICSYGRFISSLEYGARDRGLRFDANSGRVAFRGTVTNGAGQNESDENDAKSFSGRVSFAATEAVTVSGQLGVHDFVNEVDDDDDYASAWGLDAQYGGFRDGVLVQAAIAGGDNWKNLDGSGDASSFLAWQAVGSVYRPLDGDRITGWEPLVRVSSGDPDSDVDDDGGFLFTPGLMFYVQGRNKIGVNLDFYSPDVGDSEWSLKLQSFLYF